MISLRDQIAFITGASAGIGEACAKTLASQGCRTILAARRGERLSALAKEIQSKYGVACHAVTLDVRDAKAVEKSIANLPKEWSEISILINNAGLSRGLAPVQTCEIADWDEMIDTNVKGLLYVSRAILPGMISRNHGHIINIGSLAGREVYPNGNVYCATKFAVRALTDGLRLDLLGTPLRVTSVDPGMVETEFSIVRFRGDTTRAKKVYEGILPLSADDVADSVLYAATRPLHVNIAEILLMPTAQRSATVSHRVKA